MGTRIRVPIVFLEAWLRLEREVQIESELAAGLEQVRQAIARVLHYGRNLAAVSVDPLLHVVSAFELLVEQGSA